ncbi:hypothetical protein GCM10023091_33830 [Ravibacter arvi]|uniref:Uncharacterized protein n=1 Tax=Ravibacter arvi TaxID=2051041 RepID=A0ABP8M717_9BACT
MENIFSDYKKIVALKEDVDSDLSKRHSIVNDVKKIISNNAEIENLVQEEFSHEFATFMDQFPFGSPQHIGDDLNRLVVTIRSKFNFEK